MRDTKESKQVHKRREKIGCLGILPQTSNLFSYRRVPKKDIFQDISENIEEKISDFLQMRKTIIDAPNEQTFVKIRQHVLEM